MPRRTIDEIRGSWCPDLVVAASGDQGDRRSVHGTAVPYGVVGMTSAGPTRYVAGSLDASARPPVDRDHDRTRLIGRVVDATNRPDALSATIRITATPLGDETLALASDGVVLGLSTTVRPTEYRYVADDEHGQVLEVAAGEWIGLAITPDPAYSDAQISRVAATRGTTAPEEGPMITVSELVSVCAAVSAERRAALLDDHTDTIEAAQLERGDVEALVEAEIMANTPPPAPVNITASTGGQLTLARPRLPVPVDEYARTQILAMKGDSAAQGRLQALQGQVAQVEAALGETTTTTAIGLVPPQYTAEILDGLPVHTPLTNNAVRTTGLPAAGMEIIKPAWTTLPEGAYYDTENTEPPTNAVSVGTRSLGVLTWAHAVRASIATVERSTFGGFAGNYYAQTLISLRSDREARIASDMLAAVVAGPGLTDVSGALTVKAKIAALVTAQINQQLDVNGNFRGLTPTFAAVATDVWETLSGTDTDAGVAFGTARIEIGSLSGALGSLQVILVPALDAGGIIVGAQAATELRQGTEAQLRALAVDTMSYELGVIAFHSIDVEYATALAANNDAFS